MVERRQKDVAKAFFRAESFWDILHSERKSKGRQNCISRERDTILTMIHVHVYALLERALVHIYMPRPYRRKH